jgi:hypothetical protein
VSERVTVRLVGGVSMDELDVLRGAVESFSESEL